MEILSYIRKGVLKKKATIFTEELKTMNGDNGGLFVTRDSYIANLRGLAFQCNNGEIKVIKNNKVIEMYDKYKSNFRSKTDNNLDIEKIYLILDKDNRETLKGSLNKYNLKNFKDGTLITIAKRCNEYDHLIWVTDFDEHEIEFEYMNINEVIKTKKQEKPKKIKSTKKKSKKSIETKKTNNEINKWDRSKIMRDAWDIKQKLGLTLGEAIRESWTRARAEKEVVPVSEVITPVTKPVIKKITL